MIPFRHSCHLVAGQTHALTKLSSKLHMLSSQSSQLAYSNCSLGELINKRGIIVGICFIDELVLGACM